MVTIAPELPGAIDVIEQLVGDGVVVSIGHTDADAACVVDAKRAGATAVTHLFNAMAPFGHRAPGPIGVTLADDSLIAGLICDGIHVDPLAVRVAWRALGPARLMLVTDATAVLGLAPGRRRLGEVDIDVSSAGVRTADGTLAGSDLALDQAVRNLVTFTGCTATEAVATVTTTPARLLGLDDRGALEAGRRADVVVLDAGLHVVATFVGGELAHRRRRGGVAMEVVIVADAEAAGAIAAGIVERLLADKPGAVIGVATGSSPIITYRRLVEAYDAGRISFADAHVVLLDEYVGLAADHPQRYRRFVHEHLVDHVDLPTDHVHAPDVDADDLDGRRSAVRGVAGRARRCRRAVARHRHRWSRRLQRARFVVAVAYAHQDARPPRRAPTMPASSTIPTTSRVT